MIRYNIKYSKNFKKQLKKVTKQGKNVDKLFSIVDILSKGEILDIKYKDHSLIDNKYYKGCRECHIEPDWLLVYKYSNDELILYLVQTGSHTLSEVSDNFCYEKKNIMRSWTIESFFCEI